MRTTSNILGSLVIIVSGAWLFAVQAHPLVIVYQRAMHRHSSGVDPLRHFPFPPDYFRPFDWGTWWPVVCGLGSVLVGAAFVVASGWGLSKTERFEMRKENDRDC